MKWLLSVALLALVTGCGGSGNSAGSGSGGAGSTWTGEPGSIWLTDFYGNAVDRLDTATGKIAETHDVTSVGSEPTSIAVGGGSTWFTLNGHDQLSRITSDGKVEATDALAAEDVAFADGSAWVSAGADSVIRVDGQTGSTAATVQTKSGITQDPIAFGGGAAWVAAGTSIDRVDASSNTVSASIALDTQLPGIQLSSSSLAYGENALWLLAYYSNTPTRALVKIDPATNAIADKKDVPTAGPDDNIAIAFGAVWVSSESGQKLLEISPDTLAVDKEFPLQGNPTALAAGNKYLYASDPTNLTLWRVDPTSGDAESAAIPSVIAIAFQPTP